MRKILILLLLSLSCFSQEIPTKYLLQVTYTSGATEVLTVKNERGLSNIPKPIVKDDSVFYDGEYLLLNVKKIDILKTIFEDAKKLPETAISKVNYYNPQTGKEEKINVIHSPAWEASQQQVESERKSIFAVDAVKQETDGKSADANSHVPPKDNTEIVSVRRATYQVDDDGKFWKIRNLNIAKNGDNFNAGFDGELERDFVKADDSEYSALVRLNLSAGYYVMIEETYNDYQLPKLKIIKINFNTD